MITVEVTVASGNPTTETVYYFSDAKLVTESTDTPANTAFETRLIDPGRIGRYAYSDGRTGGFTKLETGEIVLDNTDARFDEWFEWHVSFAGRDLVIRVGEAGTAYPSAWTKIFTGTMESVEINLKHVTIRIRDKAYLLDKTISQNIYAGNNALPNGLEGVSGDLKGKRKPKLYGTVTNISPPVVNTSRLIYQVNDGPIATEGTAYDQGLALPYGGAYTSQTDMENNQPSAGEFRAWLDGGYFRLGATPNGLVTWSGYTTFLLPPIAAFTADVTSGEAPLTVVFTDQSTNTPSSLTWSFGDGVTISGSPQQQNPSHTYSYGGLYTVTLTAINQYGQDIETKTGYISVSDWGVTFSDAFTGNNGVPIVGGSPSHLPEVGSEWVFVNANGWYSNAQTTNGPTLNGSGTLIPGASRQSATPNQIIGDRLIYTATITVDDVTLLSDGVGFFYLNNRLDVANGATYAAMSAEFFSIASQLTQNSATWDWRVTTGYESIISGVEPGFVAGGTSGILVSGNIGSMGSPQTGSPVSFDVSVEFTATEIITKINGTEVTPRITREPYVPIPTAAVGNFFQLFEKPLGFGAQVSFDNITISEIVAP